MQNEITITISKVKSFIDKAELISKITKAAVLATKAEVFIQYSPHIHSLNVEIFEPTWDANKKATRTFTVYIDSEWKKDATEELKVILSIVRSLK